MAITIKDIARETNFSTASISRVINGGKGVGQKGREEILAVAKRLNYYPNLQARGLVAKKPRIIGIIIPRASEFVFSNPFYSEILKGISERSRQSGYYLILSFAEKESYCRLYQHRLVAGIIVLANHTNDSRYQEAQRMKIPMVLIPGLVDSDKIPSVDIDNFNAAFISVNYLIDLGHQRIALLNGPSNSKYSILRLAGYRQALKINHVHFQKDLVSKFDATQEGGFRSMQNQLLMKQPPTAVLVFNDYSAMGALWAAKEMGFRVPEDVSVVGFGDVPFSSMINPPLTTVHEPLHKIGYEATNMLLEVIQGKNLSKRNIILPVKLVIRQSTGPPPNQGLKVKTPTSN